MFQLISHSAWIGKASFLDLWELATSFDFVFPLLHFLIYFHQ